MVETSHLLINSFYSPKPQIRDCVCFSVVLLFKASKGFCGSPPLALFGISLHERQACGVSEVGAFSALATCSPGRGRGYEKGTLSGARLRWLMLGSACHVPVVCCWVRGYDSSVPQQVLCEWGVSCVHSQSWHKTKCH